MKILFSICSNNYLAQAKALGDSFVSHHPQYPFIIFLVDKLSEDIDYSFFDPHEIIPIELLGIEGFEDMFLQYDITELNTSVKPFIFNYLFSRELDADAIIYLDPDILIYRQLDELEDCLTRSNVVLTPHFFTPIYDNFRLNEPDILNAGLYNLGFIAIKRSQESQRFLQWWMIKLKDQCFIDFERGLFVDQLWINFVPIYFADVFILRHLGYNAAYWNLHERHVTSEQNGFAINETFPLVFFHFSGYSFNNPGLISKHQTRFSFETRKDLLPLFEDYHQRVVNNRFEQFHVLPCYYVVLKEKIEAERRPPPRGKIREAISFYRYRLGKIILGS